MYTKERKYTQARIQQINDSLRYGDIKEVTLRSGMHRNTVRSVLVGDFYNQQVIDVALEVISDRISKQNQIDGELSVALDSIKKIAAL